METIKHRIIAEIHRGFGLDAQAVHIRIMSTDTVNVTRERVDQTRNFEHEKHLA